MGGSFLVQAIGFFNDAYDLFVMGVVNVILNSRYPNDYTENMKSNISTSVFIGSVLGQLAFGFYADRLGRKRIMMITASLLIIGGIASAGAYGGTVSATLWVLCLCRAILGFGIGGEYPLSSTASAEGSSTEDRGKAVSSTFAMQGVGQLFAALLSNLLIQALANKPEVSTSTSGKLIYTYDNTHLDIIWRVLFGVGAIPAICILYPRYKAEENAHFNKHRSDDSLTSMKMQFICKHYGKRLIGTAGNWFLFDVVFYSQSIFATSILDSENFGTDHSLQIVSLKYVLLAAMALPGYIVAIYTIDYIGRKNMQLQGFFFMSIVFAILGFCWTALESNNAVFLFLYGATFFFSNFGPNTTTFVLPVESFPTAIRATCHGFSAAMGKVGAALGTFLFAKMKEEYGIGNIFLICSFICLLCLPLTWFFIEERSGDLSLLDDELQGYLDQEVDVVRESLSISFQRVMDEESARMTSSSRADFMFNSVVTPRKTVHDHR